MAGCGEYVWGIEVDLDETVNNFPGAMSLPPWSPTNMLYDDKRSLGRQFRDGSVQSALKLWPLGVVEGIDGTPKLLATPKCRQDFPETIFSVLLPKIKLFAEHYAGSPLCMAVIADPPHFSEFQLKKAADMADFDFLCPVYEPTASAVAYGHHNKMGTGEKNALAFDLGGGICDDSLLTGRGYSYKVNATASDKHLGSEDLYNRMKSNFEKAKRAAIAATIDPGKMELFSCAFNQGRMNMPNTVVYYDYDSEDRSHRGRVSEVNFHHSAGHNFVWMEGAKGRYKCHGCKEDGYGPRYKCGTCYEFNLHENCLTVVPQACHELIGCSFKFFDKPPREHFKQCCDDHRRKCNACGKIIEGFVYFCKNMGIALHPVCFNLKPEFSVDGVDFMLHDEGTKKKCNICGKKKLRSHVSNVPAGWFYKSKDGKYDVHVFCALQILQESMENGEVIENTLLVMKLEEAFCKRKDKKMRKYVRIMIAVLQVLQTMLGFF